MVCVWRSKKGQLVGTGSLPILWVPTRGRTQVATLSELLPAEPSAKETAELHEGA